MIFMVLIALPIYAEPSIDDVYVDEEDLFYSPCDGNDIVHLNVEVSSEENIDYVSADFSDISENIDCDGSGTPVIDLDTEDDITWTGSCNVADVAQDSNFVSGPVIINVKDAVSGEITVSTIDIMNIVLYNMTTISSTNACEKHGEASTNFCEVSNFEDVNFIVEVERNGSEACNTDTGELPWGDTFKKLVTINFASLNFNDEATLSNLGNIAQAIVPYITPPMSYGDSYIFVDTDAFALLDTIATVTLYGLPFATQPEIAGSGEVRVDSFVNNEPYLVEDEGLFISIPNSDLTFTVDGFSQYDITDNVVPIIIINTPQDGDTANIRYNADVTIDSTGTQISDIKILVDGVERFHYNAIDIFNLCTGETPGWDVVRCSFDLVDEEGDHTLTAEATDFGGELGNNANNEASFTIDVCGGEYGTCSCGERVADDYILTEDLNCSGDGLIVEESGVTLDCDGHSISGDGSGAGVYADGADSLVIKNCIIRDFQTGVELNNIADAVILDNTITNNGVIMDGFSGIHMTEVDNANILNNDISSNDYGVVMESVANSELTDNTFTYNSYEAIHMENSHNNIISGGEIGNNNQECCGGNGGIYLSASADNTISNAYMHNNRYAAIYADTDSDNITITQNNIDENCGGESGLYIYYADNAVITNNNITEGTGYGIEMKYSSGAHIASNDISRNTYNGIYIYGDDDEDGETSDQSDSISHIGHIGYIIEDNIISNNGHDNSYSGIEIYYEDDMKIKNNIVSDNSYNGISLFESTNNEISGNTIERNAHYGIRIATNNEDVGSSNIISGNTLTDNSDTAVRIGTEHNTVSGNIIKCYNEFGPSGNGIYLYSNWISPEYNVFEDNTVNECYYGFYSDSVTNFTISNDDYHDNIFGIYTNSGNEVTINDATLENNCEGIYLSETLAFITDSNFTENGIDDLDCNTGDLGVPELAGLFVDLSSEANLQNSNFVRNGAEGNYAIFDQEPRMVKWTITDTVECTDNNIQIYDGWIVPLGGEITGSNCSITIWNGSEHKLINFSEGMQGYIELDVDTSGDDEATLGSDLGFEIEIHTDESTGSLSDNLIVQFYNQNPGTANFALSAFNKWIEAIPSSDLETNLDYMILRMNYTDSELTSSGLDESTLRLEYYNETSGSWELFDDPVGGVDTANNYVWARVNHFSVFGIFGSPTQSQESSGSAPSGGSGSGGNNHGSPAASTSTTANIVVETPVSTAPDESIEAEEITENEEDEEEVMTSEETNEGVAGEEIVSEITGAATTDVPKPSIAVAVGLVFVGVLATGFYFIRRRLRK